MPITLSSTAKMMLTLASNQFGGQLGTDHPVLRVYALEDYRTAKLGERLVSVLPDVPYSHNRAKEIIAQFTKGSSPSAKEYLRRFSADIDTYSTAIDDYNVKRQNLFDGHEKLKKALVDVMQGVTTEIVSTKPLRFQPAIELLKAKIQGLLKPILKEETLLQEEGQRLRTKLQAISREAEVAYKSLLATDKTLPPVKRNPDSEHPHQGGG